MRVIFTHIAGIIDELMTSVAHDPAVFELRAIAVQDQGRGVLVFLAKQVCDCGAGLVDRDIDNIEALFYGRKVGEQSPHFCAFRAIFAAAIIFETGCEKEERVFFAGLSHEAL